MRFGRISCIAGSKGNPSKQESNGPLETGSLLSIVTPMWTKVDFVNKVTHLGWEWAYEQESAD